MSKRISWESLRPWPVYLTAAMLPFSLAATNLSKLLVVLVALAALGLALILAMAFIYIVLASQFESFLEPFLIMISLPLALVGALLALLVTGRNLGIPAIIGVVLLLGLVTMHAIRLVALTNHSVPGGRDVQGPELGNRRRPPGQPGGASPRPAAGRR